MNVCPIHTAEEGAQMVSLDPDCKCLHSANAEVPNGFNKAQAYAFDKRVMFVCGSHANFAIASRVSRATLDNIREEKAVSAIDHQNIVVELLAPAHAVRRHTGVDRDKAGSGYMEPDRRDP